MRRSVLLFVTLIVSAFAQNESICKCGDNRAVCLTESQMRTSVKHIEMAPDTMGNRVNISGVAMFEIIVGEDGHVMNARAISGNPIALAHLLESVNKWRFTPLMKDGIARQVCGRVNVQFSFVENQPKVKVVNRDILMGNRAFSG